MYFLKERSNNWKTLVERGSEFPINTSPLMFADGGVDGGVDGGGGGGGSGGGGGGFLKIYHI